LSHSSQEQLEKTNATVNIFPFTIFNIASILSNSKLVDKSCSMLSNDEIWNGNQSHDDSKSFIRNYNDIDEKKKMSNFQKGSKNKIMSKKPNHLIVRFKYKMINTNFILDTHSNIKSN